MEKRHWKKGIMSVFANLVPIFHVFDLRPIMAEITNIMIEITQNPTKDINQRMASQGPAFAAPIKLINVDSINTAMPSLNIVVEIGTGFPSSGFGNQSTSNSFCIIVSDFDLTEFSVSVCSISMLIEGGGSCSDSDISHGLQRVP
jgi:hypothetical protein